MTIKAHPGNEKKSAVLRQEHGEKMVFETCGDSNNRVTELELELEGIKRSYYEYMHNSRFVETEMDEELDKMRKMHTINRNKSLVSSSHIHCFFFVYFYHRRKIGKFVYCQ